MARRIGIIGGSGFYEAFELEDIREQMVKTPFGDVVITRGKIDDKEVFFLPRHGKKHSIPPHKINYRANVYAFYLSLIHI